MKSVLGVLILMFANAVSAGDVEDGIAAYDEGNYSVAIEKFKSGAAEGYLLAQNNLGVMYYRGQGVILDYAEAAKWYKLAAAQGYVSAQHILGTMYGTGKGVTQDFTRAYMWLNLAAASGDTLAASNRNLLATAMTRPQIIEARKLTRECLARNFQKCDPELKDGSQRTQQVVTLL